MNRRKKKSVRLISWILLLVLMMSVGCANRQTTTKPVKQQEHSVKETAKEEKRIPESLFPVEENATSEDASSQKAASSETDTKQKEEQTLDVSREDTISNAENKNTEKQEKPDTNASAEENSVHSGSTDKETVSDNQQHQQQNTIQVKISVECSRAVNAGYSGSATILSEKVLKLKKGVTVYDALEASGVLFSGSGGYVAGIAGLYEFDYGEGSGWLYYVNGNRPGIGSAQYICKDGDVIQWRYTTDMGNDL